MIEIKITTNSALQLLLERMKFELRLRQKSGLLQPGFRLEDLPYKEAFRIVEASVFDTIFLLPVEIITSQSNLVSIITSTVKALSHVLNQEEFMLFTEMQSLKLIDPIRNFFLAGIKTNNFRMN
ncbi:MAG: hypothetical protein WCZ90_05065 [Melioribacteraceae bacterium]